MSKSRDAFRTISEVSDILDTPAHVLRFWESKFTQVKPVKRAGGRRYYRPTDVDLLAGIKKLLHVDGMTIKGAQKLMREQGVKHVTAIGAEIMGSPKPQDDAPAQKVEEPAKQAPAAKMEEAPTEAAKPKAPPEPEVEATVDLDVSITNVVPMQPAAQPPKGPALSLDLSPRDTQPADAEPSTMPDIPADPSDSDSKAPARLFHLLRDAPPDALHARAAEIAPLLSRMRALRGRISLR